MRRKSVTKRSGTVVAGSEGDPEASLIREIRRHPPERFTDHRDERQFGREWKAAGLVAAVGSLVDEDEPFDKAGRLFGERRRHGAAQRVPDHGRPPHPEPGQRFGHQRGLVFHRVARAWLSEPPKRACRSPRCGDCVRAAGITPSHQSIAQVKQCRRTIGLASRGPRTRTCKSPPGRSRIRPPGTVTSADFVSPSTATALRASATARIDTRPMAIFQPLRIAAVTLAHSPWRNSSSKGARRCPVRSPSPATRTPPCRSSPPAS